MMGMSGEMTLGTWALQASYVAVLSILAMYGLHRSWLVFISLPRRKAEPAPGPPPTGLPAGGWPVVTVQLPVFNERCVVRRLVEAACALRYPEGRLEIQLLDDSTDETRSIAASLVASYRALGRDIHHVTRPGRAGYKAGALAHGLSRARGELLAVFDADFVPDPDFLERCVPRLMADPSVGMVQARWGHLNRDTSWLTRSQALLLDAHFVVEHGGRQRAGCFVNFNGTAGVFRRACIEQAGGWQADTLTEDLDLSYRAQLAGWRFEAIDDVEVPAELPAQVAALKSQQQRWAKGSIQTAVKLLPRVLRAPLPWRVKREAVLHLTANLPYLLMALLALLLVPSLRARGDDALIWLALDLPLLLAGTGSFTWYAVTAQRRLGRGTLQALAAVPALMAVGTGLCLNNGWAVIEGLFARSAPAFHRTPKEGVRSTTAPSKEAGRGASPGTPAGYAASISPVVLLEAAFALHFLVALAQELERGHWGAIPFVALFAAGFSYITLLTLLQPLAGGFTRLLRPRRAGASPAA
jgi:hypothetical protein